MNLIKKILNPRIYFPVLTILFLSLGPLFLSSFLMHLAIMTYLAATAAIAWNLIGGFAGQFSLGHSVFFGIGAYSVSILFADYGIPVCIGLLIGIIISVLLTLLIGKPAFKLTGHYFALATIAIVQVFQYAARYFAGLTHGQVGISLVGMDSANLLFQSKIPWYYLFLTLMLLALFTTWWIRRSKMGIYLLAIKNDELAAEVLGINPDQLKQIALTTSGIFITIIGAFYACYIRYIVPRVMFETMMGIRWALYSLVGGIGTVMGPLIGAFFVEPLTIFMKAYIGGEFGAYANIAYGVIFILVVFLAPDGIIKWANKIYEKIVSKLSFT